MEEGKVVKEISFLFLFFFPAQKNCIVAKKKKIKKKEMKGEKLVGGKWIWKSGISVSVANGF